MPLYSFGLGSGPRYNITTEYAWQMNQSIRDFFLAQIEHQKETGHDWTRCRCSLSEWSEKSKATFDSFEPLYYAGMMYYGQPNWPDDALESFLIKVPS